MQTSYSRQSGLFFLFMVALTLITTTVAWFGKVSEIEASSSVRVPDLDLVELATGLNQPVDIANAGDERLFVVEQKGTIRIINTDGTVLTTPFLDIDSQVCSSFQGGLLGLAFHPDYTSNGYFFVNYTTQRDGECQQMTTHISRFRVSSNDRNLADPNSEVVLLRLEQPFGDNNGGDLAFHPQDGYLYIPTGDGGTEGGITGDPDNRAQDGTSLFGKILRIDPTLTAEANPPYTIPPDNPFVNDPNVQDEIWALGLRNPWRFSFDRETGDMYVADVGERQREEINFQAASSRGGENYGWRCYEGSQAYNTTGCNSQDSYISPIAEYQTQVDGVAVTGGFVYRGNRHPGMRGFYIFADYAFGNFWTAIRDESGAWQISQVAEIAGSYSSFGEDANGELYVAKHELGNPTGGVIYHVVDKSSRSLYFPLFFR